MRGSSFEPRFSYMLCAEVVIFTAFFISNLYSIPSRPAKIIRQFYLISMIVSNLPSIRPYFIRHTSLWKLVFGSRRAGLFAFSSLTIIGSNYWFWLKEYVFFTSPIYTPISWELLIKSDQEKGTFERGLTIKVSLF